MFHMLSVVSLFFYSFRFWHLVHRRWAQYGWIELIIGESEGEKWWKWWGIARVLGKLFYRMWVNSAVSAMTLVVGFPGTFIYFKLYWFLGFIPHFVPFLTNLLKKMAGVAILISYTPSLTSKWRHTTFLHLVFLNIIYNCLYLSNNF